MIEYEKADSLSVCGLLSYSLGTAVRLIWEARDKKDLEQACEYLGTAFVQGIKTGYEDKALFLLGRMQEETLEDIRRLEIIKQVVRGFFNGLTMEEYEKLCQQIRGVDDGVYREKGTPKMGDGVYRGATPEIMLLTNKGEGMFGKEDCLKEQKYLTGELTYVPIDENPFGPRIREDMRSAEEMDLFDGDRRVR